MICFSPFENNILLQDKIDMDELLKKHPNSSIFACTEDEDILGICIYEIEGKICKVNFLKMFDDSPLLKDGLIRSLINFVDLKGIEYIVVKNEGEESFYCKIGFNPLFFRYFMIDLKGEESNYLFLDIKEFFTKGCCGSSSNNNV